MAGYTITIAPSDDEAGPKTTIRVDTASGSARITELTVRAVDGGGLSAQQLPALNLEQLIAAVTPSAPAAIVAPAPESAPPSAAAADVPESVVSQEAPAPAEPSQRAERPVRSKRAGRKAAPRKTAGRTRQAKADAAAAAQPSNGRRAYRRMPEADDVLSAYREVGGTTALARHFGVPRHTATGWLRRLRSQGLLES